MSSDGSQGEAGGEGTDPLLRREGEPDPALEEPTRLARPGRPLPAGEDEDTITRTGRVPVHEDTVVQRAPELATGAGGAAPGPHDQAAPAEVTWSEPAATAAPLEGTAPMLEPPGGLPEAPQLRLLPGGRPAERRARQREATPRLRPEPSLDLELPPELSAPPSGWTPPSTDLQAGAGASSAAVAPGATPRPTPEDRWTWWLLGVLGAAAWLAVAGALGWWAADPDLSRAPAGGELAQPER